MKPNPLETTLARFRGVLVAIRDRIDGWLHGYRRQRVGARLIALAPSSVLFVCLGNVCRSPYAASVLSGRAKLRVLSGGYLGPGRNPPPEAIQVARTRGIEHADHVSKLVTNEMLQADLIFVFDRYNLAHVRRTPGVHLARVFWLGDLDPVWTGKRAIADPWGKPVEAYVATFERIERCLAEVTRVLTRS